MIKILLIIAAVATCFPSNAFAYKNSEVTEKMKVIRAYLKKEMPCEFVAYHHVDESNLKQLPYTKLNPLLCAANLERGGGINKKSGCTLVDFNYKNGNFEMLVGRAAVSMGFLVRPCHPNYAKQVGSRNC